LIADMSPPSRRAESASYFSVAIFGGLGVGPIFGEWLLGSDDDFTQAFMYAGLFAVAAAVLACFAPSRILPLDHDDQSVDDRVPADAGNLKPPLVHPVAVLPGLVLACTVAGFATFGAFIPEYSREVGMAASGGLFAVYALSSLLVRILGARMPEQLGPRRAVTIGITIMMISLLILTLFPTAPALWIAAIFMGLGVAFNYPALMALTVNRASDRDRAMAVSSFTMFFEVGSAAGGLILGAWAQIVGKQLGFLGGVVFCVAGLWILRSKVVPRGAADAGPASTRTVAGVHYIPVAGD
jgi:MFS family permease